MILFCLWLFNGYLLAQHEQPNSQYQSNNNTPLSGVKSDVSGNPIPFASVVLYKQSDSSLVSGTATNEYGEFFIQSTPGDYFLIITFLSFKKKQSLILN